jgi:predicted RNA-binding protein YlxR (DUF448 family)
MAVGTTAASIVPGSPRERPVRTCIGCRRRAAAAVLLRVAVAPDAAGIAAVTHARSALDRDTSPAAVPVVPDPHRRIPGRGAWVHRDPECVTLAQRRRAFGRALRVAGLIDSSPVSEYVAQAAPEPSGTA